jgi:RNA polymerase sigma-70 factor (ECF subfamily)
VSQKVKERINNQPTESWPMSSEAAPQSVPETRPRGPRAQPDPETSRPDSDLEALLAGGSPDAIARIHGRYRGRLEAVSYRILRNYADAEDVVSKIFMALRRTKYRGESSLWTYLYRASVNGSVNMIRSRQRRRRAEQSLLEVQKIQREITPITTEAELLGGQILAEVSKALLYVKPQHRRVLTLRIIHGLTNTEIAEHENLPLPTVGTWLRRGREELQRALKPLMKELRKDGKP